MLRDSIDYKGTAVGKLFRRFLFPTVMGMVFSAVFVITDGIFVGRGSAATHWRQSTSPPRSSRSARGSG